MRKHFFFRKFYYIPALVVIAGVTGFLLWRRETAETDTMIARRGDFLQQVSVSGKVVPAQSVDLAFSETGRVAAVSAAVGGRVARGAVLAAIENGDVAADVLQKRAGRDAAQARLDAVRAGTRPEEIAVMESEVASAAAASTQANRALADAVRGAYTQSDDAVRRRVDQFVSNPRSSSPQLNFTTPDSRLKTDIEAWRLAMEALLNGWKDDMDALADGDGGAVLRHVDTATANLGRVRELLDVAALAVNTLTPNVNFTQTVIDGYRADITTARANINTAAATLTSSVAAQKSASATLATAEKNLTLQKAGPTPESIAENEAEVKAADADLQRAEAEYRKTIIIAPFSGTVTRVDAKVGAIASSNASAISLISADTLQIESYIPEVQAPLVRVGNDAVATMDAYGPGAPFAVTVASADPAETVRDGVSTYRVVLQFAARDERIRPGMTATVVITTEKKSGVIAIPQGMVIRRDGRTLVRVREGDAVVERLVETGSVSSMGTIEIVSGLNDGDALEPGIAAQ
jgi:HlyD family secretion protein